MERDNEISATKKKILMVGIYFHTLKKQCPLANYTRNWEPYTNRIFKTTRKQLMLPNKWKGNGSGIGVITWGSLIFDQMIINYSLELCSQISVIKIHFIKSNFFWSIDILVVNRHECIFKKYICLYYLVKKKWQFG